MRTCGFSGMRWKDLCGRMAVTAARPCGRTQSHRAAHLPRSRCRELCYLHFTADKTSLMQTDRQTDRQKGRADQKRLDREAGGCRHAPLAATQGDQGGGGAEGPIQAAFPETTWKPMDVMARVGILPLRWRPDSRSRLIKKVALLGAPGWLSRRNVCLRLRS